MNRIIIISVLFSVVACLVLASCVTDTKKTPTDTTTAPKKKVNMSALAEKLYQNFHDDPVTQAQKDENAIIDYAVDKNLDVKKTASGLYYLIKQEGQGPNLIHGQPCKVHYDGYTLDGKIFDSSHKRGKPISFSVGQMIPGWNEALKFMNAGTKATLLIPSHLAYAERGFPGSIAPHTPIAFDIEVVPLVSK